MALSLPVGNHRGNQLLELERVAEDSLKDIFVSIMIAHYQGQTVLVYNNWRKTWELPGGRIDDGETAREAAIRECFEESGQEAKNVAFLAQLRLEEAKDARLIKGAVFTCELTQLLSFSPNDEIAAIKLWDERQNSFDHIDEAFIRFSLECF